METAFIDIPDIAVKGYLTIFPMQRREEESKIEILKATVDRGGKGQMRGHNPESHTSV